MQNNKQVVPKGKEDIRNQYRLSWLAYLKSLLFLLLALPGWGLYRFAYSKYSLKLAETVGMESLPRMLSVTGMIIIVLVSAIFIYRLFFLRTVRLYTDDEGVWVYSGILPWNKGTGGVKWRDLDEAVFYTGFFSWISNSYKIRIGHRFTRESEIILYDVWRGRRAVEQINELHQQILPTIN